ncbi:hypothetical protein [Limosilactobacillus fermentum]|uniref:hypothetical protein n=1 Tax=Limosilactobacillus fermentum TaxID=1613 RepID=UPI001401FBBF|nr:hypothetical protein [Limosilactobacillus fermentum]
MTKRAEMLHVMLERNLFSYANVLWIYRRDNFQDGYVKDLKRLRKNLEATIDWLDDLIKEVGK